MGKKKHFFALGLIFIAGALDAYCYLLHDGAFASMHTGNMIQIAIKFAYGEYSKIYTYVLSILAFVIGILASHFIEKLKHYEVISIVISFICYTIGLLIPVGELNFLSNIIMSFGVALQLQAIRSIESFAVATTMCTGNLRSLSECFGHLITTKDKKYLRGIVIYSSLIISFIVGVAVMAFIIKSYI